VSGQAGQATEGSSAHAVAGAAVHVTGATTIHIDVSAELQAALGLTTLERPAPHSLGLLDDRRALPSSRAKIVHPGHLVWGGGGCGDRVRVAVGYGQRPGPPAPRVTGSAAG